MNFDWWLPRKAYSWSVAAGEQAVKGGLLGSAGGQADATVDGQGREGAGHIEPSRLLETSP